MTTGLPESNNCQEACYNYVVPSHRSLSRQHSAEQHPIRVLRSIDDIQLQLTTIQDSITLLRQTSVESLTGQPLTYNPSNPFLPPQTHAYMTSIDHTYSGYSSDKYKYSSTTDHETSSMLSSGCRESTSTNDSKQSSRCNSTTCCNAFILPLQILSLILLLSLLTIGVWNTGAVGWVLGEGQPHSKGASGVPQEYFQHYPLADVKVNITSYLEYQEKMRNVGTTTGVSLYITVISEDDWPKDAPMEKSNQVIRLVFAGGSTSRVIRFLLRNLPNLQELKIVCSTPVSGSRGENIQSRFTSYEGELNIPYLTNLTLTRFSENNFAMLTFMTHYVKVTNLKYLSIEDAVVTTKNYEYLHELLKQSSRSLIRLQLSKLRWENKLQLDSLSPFEHLLELKLDYLPVGLASYVFKRLFPALKSFILTDEFAQWNDIQIIMSCPSLEYFEAGIFVEGDVALIKTFFNKIMRPSLNVTIFAKGNDKNDVCSLYDIPNVNVETVHPCSVYK